MTKTWLISDTHFMHKNAYRFKNKAGSPMRPWDTCEEGDAVMIERWNDVVSDKDRVYHLGDVSMPRRGLAVMKQLKGRKILICGNHDIFRTTEYMEHFDQIVGTRKLGKFILSHIPLHPGSIPQWAHANIHGHMHGNIVMREKRNKVFPWFSTTEVDPRYINVCVEHTNFAPIDLEDLNKRFA